MIDVRIKQKVQDDRIVQIKKKVRFFKKLIDSKHLKFPQSQVKFSQKQ